MPTTYQHAREITVIAPDNAPPLTEEQVDEAVSYMNRENNNHVFYSAGLPLASEGFGHNEERLTLFTYEVSRRDHRTIPVSGQSIYNSYRNLTRPWGGSPNPPPIRDLQWSAADIAGMAIEPRPELTLNMIRTVQSEARRLSVEERNRMLDIITVAPARPSDYLGEQLTERLRDYDPIPTQRLIGQYRNFYQHCDSRWDRDAEGTRNDDCPMCESSVYPFRTDPI